MLFWSQVKTAVVHVLVWGVGIRCQSTWKLKLSICWVAGMEWSTWLISGHSVSSLLNGRACRMILNKRGDRVQDPVIRCVWMAKGSWYILWADTWTLKWETRRHLRYHACHVCCSVVWEPCAYVIIIWLVMAHFPNPHRMIASSGNEIAIPFNTLRLRGYQTTCK